MGSDAQWVVRQFAPNQALPDGYEVGGEWGETRDGRIGFGCFYWHKEDTGEHGEPRRTRWEARRDAIEHARKTTND